MGDAEKVPAPAPPPAAAPAAKAAAPPRHLPSPEGIAAWIRGEDGAPVGELFTVPAVAKFDALILQVRKEELLPQHWQVISDHTVRDEAEFDALPEVGRLRLHYKDQELSRRRLAGLKKAWLELGGKRPGLWTVSDLFAALRRLIEKKIEVDLTELLAAVRDLWRSERFPHGEEQLGILWNCLALVRQKTK